MTTLIDEWMPAYDAVEHHHIRIHAPREAVWAEVRRMDFGRPWIIRALMGLRSLPALLTRAGREKMKRVRDAGMRAAGFQVVAERPGDELLIGVVGKFWRPSGNIARVPAEEIRGFDQPGFAVGTWNFRVTEDDGGTTRLSTETRVRCTDDGSRRSFLRYWRIVGPFSALIRVEMLKSIRRAVESTVPAGAAPDRR